MHNKMQQEALKHLNKILLTVFDAKGHRAIIKALSNKMICLLIKDSKGLFPLTAKQGGQKL